MKRIKDKMLPKWPKLYHNDKSGELVVSGKYPTLCRRGWIKVIFIFGTLYFFATQFLAATELNDGGQTGANLIKAAVVWFFVGPLVAYFFVFLLGKTTKVTFSEDTISIKNWLTRRYALQSDMQFRFLPHERVMRSMAMDNESRRRYHNYGSVVMEYGMKTVTIAKIANQKKADQFTRMLIYAHMKVSTDEFQQNTSEIRGDEEVRLLVEDNLPE